MIAVIYLCAAADTDTSIWSGYLSTPVFQLSYHARFPYYISLKRMYLWNFYRYLFFLAVAGPIVLAIIPRAEQYVQTTQYRSQLIR